MSPFYVPKNIKNGDAFNKYIAFTMNIKHKYDNADGTDPNETAFDEFIDEYDI